MEKETKVARNVRSFQQQKEKKKKKDKHQFSHLWELVQCIHYRGNFHLSQISNKLYIYLILKA